MNYKKTIFVVNPHAGNGTTGKEWPRISKMAQEILGPFEARLTGGPGDATRITRDHLLKGADRVICVGGDGTLNEVVNGFVDEKNPLRKDAVLGFLPNGTGCDFIRTLPIPSGLEASLNTIREDHIRTIDLGYIRFLNHEGRTCTRYFHNIASFGLGGEVVDRVNRTSKFCGPFSPLSGERWFPFSHTGKSVSVSDWMTGKNRRETCSISPLPTVATMAAGCWSPPTP